MMRSTRWMNAAALSLAALLLPLLAWNGFVQQWNAGAYDILLRLQGTIVSPAQKQIVLLAIDDETVAGYGPLPIRRDLLAAGLGRIAPASPRVLAVDLLLSERSTPGADAELSKALGKFHNVVLGAALRAGPQGSDSAWISPLPEFETRAAAIGHVHVEPDPDGGTRTVLLEKADARQHYRALGLETVRLVRAVKQLPLGRLMWIRYAGPEGAFRTISFGKLLGGGADPGEFVGKIVILGVTAQGGGDRLFTPFSAGLGMPGIEIHANIIRTLLDEAYLADLGPADEFLLLLVTAAAVIAATWWRRGRSLGYIAGAGFLLVPILSYLALGRGIIVPLASWMATWLAAALLASLALGRLLRQQLREAVVARRDSALRLQAIAHEVKTPLTAIQASSELMVEASVPEQKRTDLARVIHKESKRLAGVVTTFLDVERISAGVLRLHRRPVELSAVLDQAIERAGLMAARKNIRLRADLEQVRVSADPELLEFAVYNLLTNAVKYSPNDSVVTVSLRSAAGSVRLCVADQGYGIEPAVQERIFERFYRLERDEGRAPGSGIGLALVKEIVAQHGGSIQVESTPGSGSRFTVLLSEEPAA